MRTFSLLLQLTKVGRIGVNGLPAAKNVAKGFKSVLVTAPDRSLILAGNLAKDRLRKFESATTTVKKTYSAVFYKIVTVLPMSSVLFVLACVNS